MDLPALRCGQRSVREPVPMRPGGTELPIPPWLAGSGVPRRAVLPTAVGADASVGRSGRLSESQLKGGGYRKLCEETKNEETK